MAARTKLGLLNSRDEATPLNITDNLHTIDATDVANGIEICDFFEAVEDTAYIELVNGNGSSVITIKAGTASGGTADGTAVDLTTFDKTVTIAANKTVRLPITNSSRYGQFTKDAASKACLGLYINPATSASDNSLKIAGIGKFPANYSGATLS